MNSKTLEYIETHNLTPCMNNTKWKKLVSEINSIEGYEPQVNIKYITDTNNNGAYTPVWWEEVEQDGFEIIEWIQINPFKKEHLGTLVSSRITNYTNQVKNALEKHNIHFEYDEDVFTVYGYKKSK